MAQLEIQQAFVVGDKTFSSKAEAQTYIRLPKITAALNKVSGNNKELTEWLIKNQEQVEMAFETGTIRRVTKTEGNKLAKALEALGETTDPKLAFLRDNAGAIKDSFRWPSVKRMTDEEKATAARNTLTAATEGNAELGAWILANKDAILAAYDAGVEKREVSPKASEALAAYREKMAAAKAAREAAEKEGPEALAAYDKKVADEKAAADKAKADAAEAAKA